MPIVNIPDDSLLVFDYNGSLWQIPKGEGGSNTIGITDENNDEWYIDAGDGNTYDLQIKASDDVTKTWFLELEVNMSELIGNSIIIGDLSGTDTSDATAVAGDILSGKTAYVGGSKITGTIATKTASNLSASGKTVTVPAGYYASQYTKDVATGSATTPATSITSNPTITVSSGGLITASHSGSKSITPTVSAGYVASGTAGTVSTSGSNTKQLTTKAAATYNTSASDQTIGSGQYLTGAQTIKAVKVTNLTAENIKSGVTVQVGDADSAGRIASVEGSCKAVDDITSKFSFAQNYRINYVTGVRQSGDYSVNECASSVVHIEGYKYLIISRRCVQDYNGASGLAFYSGPSRTGFISGLRDISVSAFNTDVSAVTRIAIPTGAKHVCTTWWKNDTEQASSASFICLGEL